VWKPDGTKIAFVPGCFEIYVINADGTEQMKLANGWSPTWSPDGKRIAFQGCLSEYECDFYAREEPIIYVMNSDGSSKSRIADGWYPTWSPDGKRIAYVAKGGVYAMNPDGTGKALLTTIENDRVYDLAWSPDGRAIIFEQGRDIYIVNSIGTNKMRITEGSSPAWSPDGRRIAFESEDGLCVINRDGSNRTLLTKFCCWAGVVWSADGNQIAFNREEITDFGLMEIWAIGVDGKNLRRITTSAFGDCYFPAWSPR